MTNRNKSYSPAKYRIKLKEHIDHNWSNWFEEMVISIECGVTILTGHVPDQAALHGLFTRIRDLNLTLLSVERIDSKQENKQ